MPVTVRDPAAADQNESVSLRADPGKRWPCRQRVTQGPAGAARQNQSSAKLIYLSICLRAAEADRGGIIVLGVISIATAFLFLTVMEARFHSPFLLRSVYLSKLF